MFILTDKLLMEPINKEGTMMPSPQDLKYKIILKVINNFVLKYIFKFTGQNVTPVRIHTRDN